MPTAKGKGGSAAQRYRPAAQYDDATLAQKREYWRTKKREQRARLSERRKKPTQDFQKKALCPNAPSVVNTRLSGSFADVSSPLLNNDDSSKTAKISPASQSENAVGDNSAEDNESQKERWLETIKLDKVLPQLPPSSCSISAKAAGGDTATVKCLTRGAVSKAITSPILSRTQPKTSSSVPPARVTRIINGSSAKTTPQPCVSMQGGSVPKAQHMAQVAFRIQPKLLPTNVNTGMTLAPSSRAEGKVASTTPQSGTKSALVTSQRAKGVYNAQPSPETEEEKAAKRREHWRIKKREQRAKMAARLAKARERTQGSEMTLQRQAAQKTGYVGCTNRQHLPSQPFLRSVGQKQCPPRIKMSSITAKQENDEQQIGAAGLAPVNLLAEQVKLKNPNGKSTTQTVITSDAISVKKPGESHRKPPSYVHLSNVTRGIARCKTPRQKFIEAQKNLMNQRNLRCKTPLLTSVFGTRNIPKIDPNDTPEQIIAKRREYWRIKKREQRAKLSMEVKTRLKEKDSLMRRVKRYQKILEEMRRARALTQTAGSTLPHASEAIGGFIKEDGTVTISVPQVPAYLNAASHKSGEDLHVVVSNKSTITKPQHQLDTKQKSIASVCTNQPPQLCLPQVKVSVPLSGRFVNKPPKLLSIRPRTQLESTTASKSNSLAIQAVGQLTLTHPQTAQNGGSAAGSNLGGCVMKMAVSNRLPSVLSLDPELSEEEKMAKKREYWRIKKREQRAARAARLKQGLLQARVSAALQRRKAQKQVAVTTGLAGRRLANHTQHAPLANNSMSVMPHASEIKQESESVPADDLNSQPEEAICPDIKPPTSPTPPTPPQADPDPALNADSQATTLLAVASMKKLLEESLSTVTERKSEQSGVKIESVEEASDSEVKPNLSQLCFEKDEVAPITADLTLEIKSWRSDADVLVQAGSTSPLLKDTQQKNLTFAPLPSSNEVVPHTVCEHSSQTPANFIVDPTEASVGLSSLDKTQRLCTEMAGHQNRCSPEPPKLHHLPMDQHCEQQCRAEEQCPNSNSPSAQRYCSLATEHSGLTSLQRKREYWKLMKRQQRARLKARQTERRGECSSQLSKKNTQVM